MSTSHPRPPLSRRLQGGKVGAKAVATITGGNNFYRTDLQKAALARFSKMSRVGSVKKA